MSTSHYPPPHPATFSYSIYPPLAPPSPFPPPLTSPPYPLIAQTPEADISRPKEPNPFLDASPLMARLGTNYAPKADEVKAVRDAISRMQPEVDEEDKRLARLQEEMDQITRQRALRIDFIEAHNALLTPIRHMPTEIIQEIFYQVVHSGPPTIRSMHKDDMPMVLTRVCQSWREIALQTPRLWAFLHIAIPHDPIPGETVTPSRIVGIQEWLRRSGSVPLHISIFQEGSGGFPRLNSDVMDQSLDAADLNIGRSMKEIIGSIRSSVPRWRCLSLGIPFPSLGLFENIPPSDFAMLQDFTFTNTNPYYPRMHSIRDFGAANIFQSPMLSYLRLFHLPPQSNPLSYSIRWTQITHLALDCTTKHVNYEPYIRPLELIQNTIEDLTLTITILGPYGQPDLDQAPTTLIHLPRLKRLAVREQDSLCPAFGRSIRCPALEHLEYHEYPTRRWPDSISDTDDALGPLLPTPTQGVDGSLSTILAHSGDLIKTLVFNPNLYESEEIIRYLSCTPLVETICFRRQNGAYSPAARGLTHNGILKAFVTRKVHQARDADAPGASSSTSSTHLPPRADTGVLCPQVSILDWQSTSTFAPDEFFEFLELKQGGTLDGVARLKRVTMHLKSPLLEEQAKRLPELLPFDGGVGSLVTYDPPVPPIPPGSRLRAGVCAEI